MLKIGKKILAVMVAVAVLAMSGAAFAKSPSKNVYLGVDKFFSEDGVNGIPFGTALKDLESSILEFDGDPIGYADTKSYQRLDGLSYLGNFSINPKENKHCSLIFKNEKDNLVFRLYQESAFVENPDDVFKWATETWGEPSMQVSDSKMGIYNWHGAERLAFMLINYQVEGLKKGEAVVILMVR